MSEKLHTNSSNDIPNDMIGSYSTWKQKDGSGKDSNHHTYLVGSDGKKQVISRANFEKKVSEFHSISEPSQDEDSELDSNWQPTPRQRFRGDEYSGVVASNGYPGDWTKLPRPRDWSGYSQKPNKEANEEPGVDEITGVEPEGAGRTEYWVGNKIYSEDITRKPGFSLEEHLKKFPESEPSEKEKSPHGRGLLRKIGRFALVGAFVIAPYADSLERRDKNDYSEPEPPVKETTVGEMPSATPEDFIIKDSTSVATLEAAKDSGLDAVSTSVADESTSVPVEVEVANNNSPDEEGPTDLTGESIVEPTEATPPLDTSTGETYSDTPKIESIEDSPAIEPIEDSAEVVSDSTELSSISVEVAPEDGITQVIGKILEQAGYSDVSPEQLYYIYEDLVTDPSIGPDGIFLGDGIAIEYDSNSGEYRIVNSVGNQAQLKPAAADLVDRILDN